MDLMQRENHKIVREGYRILMRVDSALFLPKESSKLLDFYETLARDCLTWAVEIRGEALRLAFCALSTIQEKSRFQAEHYQLRIWSPWEEGEHIAFVCESEWRKSDRKETELRRIAHVWSMREFCMLPPKQTMRLFHLNLADYKLGFSPDGVYPQGESIIAFRNKTESSPFSECKILPER